MILMGPFQFGIPYGSVSCRPGLVLWQWGIPPSCSSPPPRCAGTRWAQGEASSVIVCMAQGCGIDASCRKCPQVSVRSSRPRRHQYWAGRAAPFPPAHGLLPISILLTLSHKD